MFGQAPLEFRITFLGGRPLMASYHGPYSLLPENQRSVLVKALTSYAPLLRKLKPIATRLSKLPLAPNFTGDVAFLKSGKPVVIELNPVYAAGYNVPSAHAWLVVNLGAKLAERAGYGRCQTAQLRSVA